MLFALGSALFAGLTAVFAKVGAQDIPSNLLTLLRTTVIFLFVALIVCVRSEWQNPLRLSHHSLIFIVLSGLAAGLSWLCYYKALQVGTVSLVASIDKLSLVIGVGLSVLFLGEKLTHLQWVGVVLISLGTFLIALKR